MQFYYLKGIQLDFFTSIGKAQPNGSFGCVRWTISYRLNILIHQCASLLIVNTRYDEFLSVNGILMIEIFHKLIFLWTDL